MNTDPQLISDMPDDLFADLKARVAKANDAAQLYGLDAGRKVIAAPEGFAALLSQLKAEAQEKADEGTKRAIAGDTARR